MGVSVLIYFQNPKPIPYNEKDLYLSCRGALRYICIFLRNYHPGCLHGHLGWTRLCKRWPSGPCLPTCSSWDGWKRCGGPKCHHQHELPACVAGQRQYLFFWRWPSTPAKLWQVANVPTSGLRPAPGLLSAPTSKLRRATVPVSTGSTTSHVAEAKSAARVSSPTSGLRPAPRLLSPKEEGINYSSPPTTLHQCILVREHTAAHLPVRLGGFLF
jgi:hypothetical protein